VFEFKLPDLGEGIAEGEILKWHVTPGGAIKEDEPLLDVETDKAAVTIPSPRGGTVEAIKGTVGDIVNVGDVIIVIDDGTGSAETSETQAAEEVFAAPDGQPAAPVPDVHAPAAEPGVRRPVPAAPATRRLARKLKIDINLVTPTGPGGRVTPEDVHRFAGQGGMPAAAADASHVKARSVTDDRAFAEFAAHASATIPFLELEPLPNFSVEGPVEIEPLRSIRRKVARKIAEGKTHKEAIRALKRRISDRVFRHLVDDA